MPIVIDCGSSQIRVGIAGEEHPAKVFPNIVRRGAHSSEDKVGDEAYDCGQSLGIR